MFLHYVTYIGVAISLRRCYHSTASIIDHVFIAKPYEMIDAFIRVPNEACDRRELMLEVDERRAVISILPFVVKIMLYFRPCVLQNRRHLHLAPEPPKVLVLREVPPPVVEGNDDVAFPVSSYIVWGAPWCHGSQASPGSGLLTM